MDDKIMVLLSTEGTYPYHHGGVSQWCDLLVQKLKPINYVIHSVVMNPFVNQKYILPSSTKLTSIPLWGTEEPSEHLTIPFSQIYLSKKKTVPAVIKEHFLPLFIELISEIISPEKNPKRFAHTLHALYQYFKKYEYKESFKSELTWTTYKDFILSKPKELMRLHPPDIYGLIQSLGWVYRFLNIINTPIPRTNVTHSAAAAFCGIPCVLAKLEYNTPFLLTEHGVYLREQYLSLANRRLSPFLNSFLIRLVNSVATLNYSFADQISPVCNYNTRWEKKLGVEPERINVIYNGVDERKFSGEGISVYKKNKLTVVTVARIDPYKDILSLIKAASMVRKKMKDVQFVIYGAVSVPEYYKECLALRDELELEETVIFAGHTDNIPAAYLSGDVIALSSITEAFPYAIVEAMMAGKPVVTTNVGGVKEAVGETGIVVNPRVPEELAEGILTLLNDESLRNRLGRYARERALQMFTLNKVLDLHLKTYIHLSISNDKESWKDRRNSALDKQKKFIAMGYTLLNQQLYKEAIAQFYLAIDCLPNSPHNTVILAEIAKAYYYLGEEGEAVAILEDLRKLA